MSCGVGSRFNLDPALLWPWHRPVATVPLGHLPWEPAYSKSVALFRNLFSQPKTFLFFRAALAAHGGSQARGPIGTTAAGLHHSPSSSGSQLHLRPTPHLMATPDP